MKKLFIEAAVPFMAAAAAVLIAAACLTGCPVPNSGGGNPAQAAREKADAFKTIHTGVLDKTITNITTGDEAAVIEALAAYEALGDEEKVLLSGEKTLLDSLKARIDALKGKDAFAADHGAVLDNTPPTLTTADDAAVNAALAA